MMTDLPFAALSGPVAPKRAPGSHGAGRPPDQQTGDAAFGRLLNEGTTGKPPLEASEGEGNDHSSLLMSARLRQRLASSDDGEQSSEGSKIETASEGLSAEVESHDRQNEKEMAADQIVGSPDAIPQQVTTSAELVADTRKEKDAELEAPGARTEKSGPAYGRSNGDYNGPAEPAILTGQKVAALARADGLKIGHTKNTDKVPNTDEAPKSDQAQMATQKSVQYRPTDTNAISSQSSQADSSTTPKARSETIGLVRNVKAKDGPPDSPENTDLAMNAASAAPASATALGRTGVVPPVVTATALDQAASSLSHAIDQHLTVSQMQEFNGGRTKVLKLQLQPAHLGQLEIVLKDTNGRLSVQIQTGSTDAQDTLMREKTSLRTALDEANLSVEALSIEAPRDRRPVASFTQVDSAMNQAQQGAGDQFDERRSNAQTDENRQNHHSEGFTDFVGSGSEDGNSGSGTPDAVAAGLRI
ncbi:flagellar hook-length control protein FliK [Notoacmeibacter sp. MSK16QG-6]|uniref:flagellar hook-length control protein FliK n=1 Tax=Notoacmeibacter sp. MSK16QG-6 TaxID=2957982 RepID=UPI00209E14D4|nr:flagellar hook-length control protein FliK [Notoacmeibacter sp. MSK16QG-6]MCP1200932.1 flagellar hook-length control protein FliK [Notoacmeibacter sp. MSK16QG-6]